MVEGEKPQPAEEPEGEVSLETEAALEALLSGPKEKGEETIRKGGLKINISRFFRGEEQTKERKEKAAKEAEKERRRNWFRQPIGREEDQETDQKTESERSSPAENEIFGDQGGMPTLDRFSRQEFNLLNNEELNRFYEKFLKEEQDRLSGRALESSEKETGLAMRNLHQMKRLISGRISALEQNLKHFEYLETHSPRDSSEAREAGALREDAQTKLGRLKEKEIALKIAREEAASLRFIPLRPDEWDSEFAKKINHLNNLIKTLVYRRTIAKSVNEADVYEGRLAKVYKILNGVWAGWQEEAKKRMSK